MKTMNSHWNIAFSKSKGLFNFFYKRNAKQGIELRNNDQFDVPLVKKIKQFQSSS